MYTNAIVIDRGERRPREGYEGRSDYRRGPVGGTGRGFGGPDKKIGAGSDFNPQFRGGYGRGRGGPAE